MNIVQSISERRLAHWVEDGSKMLPLKGMKHGFIPSMTNAHGFDGWWQVHDRPDILEVTMACLKSATQAQERNLWQAIGWLLKKS